jgi:hypothetical protein
VLGSLRPGWDYPSARWLAEAERLAALDARLPAVLKGAKPLDASEAAGLAELCLRFKALPATAARFYADAFASRPALADDLEAGHRFSAACAAARAGCGREDGDKLDEKERARLRRQALDWLSADLAAWEKRPQDARARQRLQAWQNSPDLAGVRDRESLAKLPPEEGREWAKLWARLDQRLKAP